MTGKVWRRRLVAWDVGWWWKFGFGGEGFGKKVGFGSGVENPL